MKNFHFQFFLWTLAFCQISLFSQAQKKLSPVFKNGEHNYTCFRIPAIIKAPNNDLLAFAEARKKGCNDFGDIDLVMKTSTDKGKTWSDLKIVVDNDVLKAGNPAPVVDHLDPKFPDGKIFLLYNTFCILCVENKKHILFIMV